MRKAQPLIVGGKVSYRNIADAKAEIEGEVALGFHCDPRNAWRYAPPPETVMLRPRL